MEVTVRWRRTFLLRAAFQSAFLEALIAGTQSFLGDFCAAGVVTSRHNGGEATPPPLKQNEYEYEATDSL
jgi:hypothetical protein